VHPIVKKEGIDCRKSVQAEKSFSRQDSLVEASTDNVTQILSKHEKLPLRLVNGCVFLGRIAHGDLFGENAIL
jgi:hypothetical protein